MARPKPNSPYRLIVEGSDDLNSITGLLMRHGYDWDDESLTRPYIDSAGSIDQALEALPVAAKTYQRVGLVIDADLSLANRWTSVRDRLVAAGWTMPQAPERGGTTVERDGVRLGVWLMPDNQQPGMLEHFLARLVPQGDACWGHAEASTAEAREKHGAPLAEAHHIKGAIYSWLAWRKDPGLPFGTALKAHLLGHDSREALSFVEWFRRLFVM